MNNCLNCNKETNNPKYCSRSCSARINNKRPKRTRIKQYCKYCNLEIPRDYSKLPTKDRRVICDSCFERNIHLKHCSSSDGIIKIDSITAICEYHLCDKLVSSHRSAYCSHTCRNKAAVIRRRKKIKEMAVEYKGGECSSCGYSTCVEALDFHHLDPNEKDFSISRRGHCRSWDKVRAELDKCVLLCANCHRELHAGLVEKNV